MGAAPYRRFLNRFVMKERSDLELYNIDSGNGFVNRKTGLCTKVFLHAAAPFLFCMRGNRQTKRQT